jgi:hypothetical protein
VDPETILSLHGSNLTVNRLKNMVTWLSVATEKLYLAPDFLLSIQEFWQPGYLWHRKNGKPHPEKF